MGVYACPVCELELIHKPKQAAAALQNYLHTVERPARPASCRDGCGGFKLVEGTQIYILQDPHVQTDI